MKNKSCYFLSTIIFLLLSFVAKAEKDFILPVRIKDLVEIKGVRSNPLTGFGLVVGLAGTGDSKQSLATNKAASHMLNRLGIDVSPQEVITKNIAAVLVTAELPVFARVGDKLTVRLSAIGDATGLEGGHLIMTPLSAADSKIYAVAQGVVTQGNNVFGATVEREFDQTFIHQGKIELSLKNPDFTTANRLGKAINEFFGDFLATPINSGQISVNIPKNAQLGPSFDTVAFVAALEQIKVDPDTKAVVIINERTGTVIAGNNVTVAPVVVSHGNLEIVVEDGNAQRISALPKALTVAELAAALNKIGAGPRDLVAIMQALDAAKALKAELKIL